MERKINKQGTASGKPRLGAVDISALLKKEILSGNFRFHDKLPPERRLAHSYGVARGTVHQALARLERDNLVEIRPGSGAFIVHAQPSTHASPIHDSTPLELIDARFALEPHMCRLAVMHGRRQDFDRLEGLCDSMEQPHQDTTTFSTFDTEIHLVLANSTANKLLIWMITQITLVRGQDEWRRMRRLTLNEQIILRYNLQHRQIVDAIRAREPERAAGFMKEHLETARLSLTRAAET